VRPDRICQRKFPEDHRLDITRLEQGPDILAQLRHDIGLELDRTRSQCGTRDGQAPAQDLAEIDFGLSSAKQGDDQQATVVCQSVDLPRNVIAAGHVEDHIDAFAAG
jgi:hypothetical protein